ncbi:MAG: (Fe-S)-binding protein [Lysobacterales bacterium]
MNEVGTPLDALRRLADGCVMCGLCLPHCPTFAWSGVESQSPRGRIALIRLLASEVPEAAAMAAEPSVRAAVESCLQCRACERVCPAGVPFGELIEGARARWFVRPLPPLAAWMTRSPGSWARAAGLAGALRRRLPMPGRRARMAVRARRPLRLRAGAATSVLFVGCAARSFESESQRALLACAQALELPLLAPAGQGCCGALAQHMGQAKESQLLADRLRQCWQRARTQTVVAMDSGCLPALRQGAQGLRVVEACRWLLNAPVDWSARLHRRAERVGLYLPCTHRNVVGDVAAVWELLALMPELEVVPIQSGFGCCGAAGPHLLLHADQADALAAPIVDQIIDAQLDRLLTTNVGCALHLGERLAQRGVELPITHPVACLRDRLRP